MKKKSYLLIDKNYQANEFLNKFIFLISNELNHTKRLL